MNSFIVKIPVVFSKIMTPECVKSLMEAHTNDIPCFVRTRRLFYDDTEWGVIKPNEPYGLVESMEVTDDGYFLNVMYDKRSRDVLFGTDDATTHNFVIHPILLVDDLEVKGIAYLCLYDINDLNRNNIYNGIG